MPLEKESFSRGEPGWMQVFIGPASSSQFIRSDAPQETGERLFGMRRLLRWRLVTGDGFAVGLELAADPEKPAADKVQVFL